MQKMLAPFESAVEMLPVFDTLAPERGHRDETTAHRSSIRGMIDAGQGYAIHFESSDAGCSSWS